MATPAKSAIPEGYTSVTPYLICKGAGDAIGWYVKNLGAKELMRFPAPGGMVGHAEIQLGNARVMLADEYPNMSALSPKTIGGTAVGLCVYVEDCDAVIAQCLEAGATEERPVQDQFYGDRSGTVVDPFGHKWTISTHIEDVSPEEMGERMKNLGAG